MTTDSFGKIACPHCEGHIEYPPEASGVSVECPHCQQTVTLRARSPKSRLLGLVILIVAVSLAGWVAWLVLSHKSAPPSKARPSILPNPLPLDFQRTNGLAFWDFSIQRKQDSTITHAVARVLNESDSIRYGVEVRFELLDELGRPLGSCRDYIERLEPNQDTYVRALVIKRAAAKARLLGISEQ